MKPAVVATAFPPLKSRKIEKVWPKIATIPNNIPNGCGPRWKIAGKSVAKVPFKTSTNKTLIPATGPKVLKVLVDPGLPEPNLRISL